MKDILKLSLLLALFAAVCGGLLAYVSGKTRSPIEAANEARTVNAAKSVLPKGVPAPVAVDGMDGCFVSRDAGGRVVAVAAVGESQNGYGGAIRLMVGIDAAGTVCDIKVVAANETPGLGAKIDGDDFKAGVRGRALTQNWTVKKDGGDVDAVTSATISSRAACEAIRDAIAKFEKITKR